ncbi:MAG: hypothetical protein UZ12_BCD005000187 [Bacteroidetes bacterium OLB12]|nr:MAG: hypothetical protein UZ12_BCD005000187 [Bacteroidetes bacterium OLB12]HNR73226.1 hypothetical protein [Cyclobacteriaceae bacterium]HNU41108.1 hypothetical protein [Cyclobacteriaceae bacterium]
MKKLVYAVLCLSLLGMRPATDDQECNSENLATACIPKLSDGFNFLKSYKVDGLAKDKVEYSYVFTKGTQYLINLCANGTNTDGIVVSIFDKERNKVATSKVNGQFISAIAYPCNATGIYYIQYTFDEPSSHCGGSAMGFKR